MTGAEGGDAHVVLSAITRVYEGRGARPDVEALGPLTMHVIERGGRFGIRLKDKDSPLRKEFKDNRFDDGLDLALRVVEEKLTKKQPADPLKK